MTSKTLTQFLVEQEHGAAALPHGLRLLIESVAAACQKVGYAVNRAALDGLLGNQGQSNIQGEEQKRLDVLANDSFLEDNSWGGHLAGMASEEMDSLYPLPEGAIRGDYLLLFDPIDGSSNVDVDLSVGTIFSVLNAPADAANRPLIEADFLQNGRQQVAAGYAIYGPQTLLVLTVGNGVYEFGLDTHFGAWVLLNERLQIPAGHREFAINMSNYRHWSPGIRHYVDQCLAGKTGAFGANYNMRWTGSMVADIHRIFKRGGIFIYPWDDRTPEKAGKLRLMYEANPMGFLIEQAGGLAYENDRPILDGAPTGLHQRVEVIIGDKAEVERVLSSVREA